jgi:hypothetical protein
MRTGTFVPLLVAAGLLSSAAVAGMKPGDAPTSDVGGTTSVAGKPFEGQVTMNVTTEHTAGPQRVDVRVRGDRVRYDLPPSSNTQHQPLQAIVDMGSRTVTLVMPAQKQYSVIDFNKIPPEEKQAAEQKIGAETANWTASRTGATKSLAGHPCDQWEAVNTASNLKVEACLAPGVRMDFDRILPASLFPKSWADRLRNGELPLSATVLDSAGKPTFNEQVTRIQTRPVADSELRPPAGYKKVELPMTEFGNYLPSSR